MSTAVEICAYNLRNTCSKVVDQTDEYHTHTYGAAETLRRARAGVTVNTEEPTVRSRYAPHNPCLGFDWLDTREAARSLPFRETRGALNQDMWDRGITPPRPEPNTRGDWWCSRGVQLYGRRFALRIGRNHRLEEDAERAQRREWQRVIDDHQQQQQQQQLVATLSASSSNSNSEQ